MINKFLKSPEFDVGDFLKFVGCKMASIKILKLNGTPEFHPTAWMLTPRLSAWPLRGHRVLKSILEDILQPT